MDLVVHAGDVFNRSHVDPSVAWLGLEPLRRVAAQGVPVFIVPGNHERSRLPHPRFALHPNVHLFDRARTFRAVVRGVAVAISGFPYERDGVRSRFTGIVRQAEARDVPAAVRLLCMHHCVEGATVGPANHVFTTAPDVVRHRDIPAGVAAVLSGHIHRHQVLTTDLAGRPLATPVLYPGSIDRTSVAEIGEPKGFLMVTLSDDDGPWRVSWEFRRLPTRPMIRHDLRVDRMAPAQLASTVDALIAAAPVDAVLCLRVLGALAPAQWPVLSASRLRKVAPASMNVEVSAGALPSAGRPAPPVVPNDSSRAAARIR